MDNLGSVYVPNSYKPVSLTSVARVEAGSQPSSIFRENRTRYIQLAADLTPGGAGLGGTMQEVTRLVSSELKPPPGVSHTFVGQAERFKELMTSILAALGLGILFIYLVLASLYESFVTPFTIMLVIPLAAAGAFVSLWVAHSSFDLYDRMRDAHGACDQKLHSLGRLHRAPYCDAELDTTSALLAAGGRARLRPILMTSLAMIAGMLPVAIGLNEASKSRTSLGIVVVGGTISSTLLTLYIIPAAFIYIDRFQRWFFRLFNRYIRGQTQDVDIGVVLEAALAGEKHL